MTGYPLKPDSKAGGEKRSFYLICQKLENRKKNGGEESAVRTEKESERRSSEEKWQSHW